MQQRRSAAPWPGRPEGRPSAPPTGLGTLLLLYRCCCRCMLFCDHIYIYILLCILSSYFIILSVSKMGKSVMFIYTEHDIESDRRIKNINFQYKSHPHHQHTFSNTPFLFLQNIYFFFNHSLEPAFSDPFDGQAGNYLYNCFSSCCF